MTVTRRMYHNRRDIIVTKSRKYINGDVGSMLSVIRYSWEWLEHGLSEVND